MVKGKTPEFVDEFPSNNSKLTYRKGVLFCSSVSDVANSHSHSNTLASNGFPSCVGGVKPKIESKNNSSLQFNNNNKQNSHRSSCEFEGNSYSKEDNPNDLLSQKIIKINNNNIIHQTNGHHYPPVIIENEEKSIIKPVKLASKKSQGTTVLKRSDIVTTDPNKTPDSQDEQNKKIKGEKTRGIKGFIFGRLSSSQQSTTTSPVGLEKKTQQLGTELSPETSGPHTPSATLQTPSELTMASSVMNQHHSHYSNYNQRNYNNNHMNMSHGQYGGKKSSSSTTSSGHSTTNGYYNYPHSASMSEITDNRYYNQKQNSTTTTPSSSYYNTNGSNQASISNSTLPHHQSLAHQQIQNQIESRKEQRERREKDFVPSFVLIDACKTNNERKVREICRKLSTLCSDDVQPVVNFQDQTGRTSMSFACEGGNINILDEVSRIRYLDPNLADNDGNTPLHYACQSGHSEAVDIMLARFDGALDINCRNATGLTPLMKAAVQGRTRCAKSLLAAGASSHLRDYSRGFTAVEWARYCGRHICSDVITRGSKDNQRHSGSPVTDRFQTNTNRPALPGSRSMDLKRMNSDESPYYHLYARSTISGATWLKNKIKKALGASGGNASSGRSLADRRPTVSEGSYTLMSNIGGATICAGSLLLPSIKPLIEQQRPKPPSKKFTIPTVQVTPVKR